MDAMVLTYWAMLALFGLRVAAVHRANMRRFDVLLNRLEGDIPFEELLRVNQEVQNIPSFWAMLLDLRKWTYKQFFPKAA